MNITILGLSITSSWGNGHATTYRSLVKGLHERGHQVVFLERDMPWYSSNRDMPDPDYCSVILYDSPGQLQDLRSLIDDADAVIVGSYVPDGVAVGEFVLNNACGVTAFYDIDTPVTLAKLRNNECKYISPHLIPGYDIYLSFSAGKCLEIFECEYGSPAARQFYCSVDPDLYYPLGTTKKWDLGYLGTYSEDRQSLLNELLVNAARKWEKGKFAVAGPQYPPEIKWPENVERIEHLPPDFHNEFYNAQRFTLNITRKDMVKMGYSPSVRLFEAAACAIPMISDWWEGLDTIFRPGEEILISRSPEETLRYLRGMSEEEIIKTGEKARETALKHHTGLQRAIEFEKYVSEAVLRRGTHKRSYIEYD